MPLLCLAYVAAFALYWRTPRPRSLLVAAGRTGLSHYLGQSVVCVLLFYGIGLGLFGRVSYAVALLIAVAVFLFLSWLGRLLAEPVSARADGGAVAAAELWAAERVNVLTDAARTDRRPCRMTALQHDVCRCRQRLTTRHCAPGDDSVGVPDVGVASTSVLRRWHGFAPLRSRVAAAP